MSMEANLRRFLQLQLLVFFYSSSFAAPGNEDLHRSGPEELDYNLTVAANTSSSSNGGKSSGGKNFRFIRESSLHCSSSLSGPGATVLAGPIRPLGLSPDLISINCSHGYGGTSRPSIQCNLKPGFRSLPCPVFQWSEEATSEGQWMLNSRLDIVADQYMNGSRFSCWVVQESNKSSTGNRSHDVLDDLSWMSEEIQAIYFEYSQPISTINRTDGVNETCTVTTNLPCQYNWFDITAVNGIYNTGSSWQSSQANFNRNNGSNNSNNCGSGGGSKSGISSASRSSSTALVKQSGRHLILESSSDNPRVEVFQCHATCEFRGQLFDVTANAVVVITPVSCDPAGVSPEVLGALAGIIVAFALILIIIVVVCLIPICSQKSDTQGSNSSCPKACLAFTGGYRKASADPDTDQQVQESLDTSNEEINETLLCKNDNDSELLRARIAELEEELGRISERQKSTDGQPEQNHRLVDETNPDKEKTLANSQQVNDETNNQIGNCTERTRAALPKSDTVAVVEITDESYNNGDSFRDDCGTNKFRELRRDVENANGKLGNTKDIKVNRTLIVLGLESSGRVDQVCCQIDLTTTDNTRTIRSTPTSILNESAACVHNNVLYVAGIGVGREELWKWTPILQSWSRCESLPSGRRRHALTSVEDDRLCILGGWSNEENCTLDSILSYDIVADRWEPSGRLWHAVRGAASVSYQGHIYLFGGSNDEGKSVDYVQDFDTTQRTCKLLPSSMPQPYKLMKAALFTNIVVLIGRYACFVWNIENKTWQNRCPFRTGVDHFGLVLDNDTIFVVGGGKVLTDSDGKQCWVCSDEVVALPVQDLVAGKLKFNLRHHAKLPSPSLVHACSPVSLAVPRLV